MSTTNHLAAATPEQLRQIMAWLPDRRSSAIWGGPGLRFPFSESTFLQDSRLNELPSYALLGTGGEMLGFGQYYLRVGRCHLGRLIIDPTHRGKRLGEELIVGLVELGSRDLAVAECSLFVVPDNVPALRLYERLGFERVQYPEDEASVATFYYMIAPTKNIATAS